MRRSIPLLIAARFTALVPLLGGCTDASAVVDGATKADPDGGASPLDLDALAEDASFALDGGPPPCAPALELGSGAREWQPVDDGDTLYLYWGPQGGYHLYLSVRARGLDPSDVNVCYVERYKDTGEKFGEGCWRVRLRPVEGAPDLYERIGILGQVYDQYTTMPYLIRGHDAEVEVMTTDRWGCSASDGFWIHVHEEPGR